MKGGSSVRQSPAQAIRTYHNPLMVDAEFNRQLQRDTDTLRLVVTGLEQLVAEWRRVQLSVAARQRGYFTPDEDDWVRQLLLSYRNYRIALYEIIHRYSSYRQIPDLADRLRGFLVGLGTGLTLYSNSLKLVQAYEREPLVRNKLNEPDAKFDLEAGFFEDVLRNYSSLIHYLALIKGIWFWQANRRQIQRLAASGEWRWLLDLIRGERTLVRRRLTSVLVARARYDWRTFWETTFQPVRRTRYGVQSLIGGACASIRTTRNYRPSLSAKVIEKLQPLLRPGDVLLVRAEEKLTSALLPGFWAHAALYIGCRSDLEELGLGMNRHVTKHLQELEQQTGQHGSVIEAISPRVMINRLETCLIADHVLVLRPNLPSDQIATALGEAFGHVGKPYDFEFDFNVSTRLVCTEVIYRCYHRRGSIEFSLLKRLGRFTLTADDIAGYFMERFCKGTSAPEMPFRLIALVLKKAEGNAEFISPPEMIEALQRIQAGWRPRTVMPGSANHAFPG